MIEIIINNMKSIVEVLEKQKTENMLTKRDLTDKYDKINIIVENQNKIINEIKEELKCYKYIKCFDYIDNSMTQDEKDLTLLKFEKDKLDYKIRILENKINKI